MSPRNSFFTRQERRCPHCGAIVNPNSDRCLECNTEIKNNFRIVRIHSKLYSLFVNTTNTIKVLVLGVIFILLVSFVLLCLMFSGTLLYCDRSEICGNVALDVLPQHIELLAGPLEIYTNCGQPIDIFDKGLLISDRDDLQKCSLWLERLPTSIREDITSTNFTSARIILAWHEKPRDGKIRFSGYSIEDYVITFFLKLKEPLISFGCSDSDLDGGVFIFRVTIVDSNASVNSEIR